MAAEPAARPVVTAEPRRAYHVGVAVGLTTGAYALALLAVTQVQAERDNAQIAERAPAVQAIEMLGAHHDQMSSQLEQARQRYLAGAAVYNDLVGQLSDVDQGIADLNATLAQIEAMGTGAYGIPTGPIAVTKSGGGTKSKGTTTAPALAPPPAPAPPPTTATSGASGG